MSSHREIFEEFAERAEGELAGSLEKLVLYGSVAREEETSESDIDVFAVVEEQEDLEKLEDIAFEVGVIEHGVFISVQGQEEESFRERRQHPFITTVMDEGEAYV